MGAGGAMHVRAQSPCSKDTRCIQRSLGVRDGISDAARQACPESRRVLQNDTAIETRGDRLSYQSDRTRTRPDAHTHGVQLLGTQIRLDLRVRLSPDAFRQAN